MNNAPQRVRGMAKMELKSADGTSGTKRTTVKRAIRELRGPRRKFRTRKYGVTAMVTQTAKRGKKEGAKSPSIQNAKET